MEDFDCVESIAIGGEMVRKLPWNKVRGKKNQRAYGRSENKKMRLNDSTIDVIQSQNEPGQASSIDNIQPLNRPVQGHRGFKTARGNTCKLNDLKMGKAKDIFGENFDDIQTFGFKRNNRTRKPTKPAKKTKKMQQQKTKN